MTRVTRLSGVEIAASLTLFAPRNDVFLETVETVAEKVVLLCLVPAMNRGVNRGADFLEFDAVGR